MMQPLGSDAAANAATSKSSLYDRDSLGALSLDIPVTRPCALARLLLLEKAAHSSGTTDSNGDASDLGCRRRRIGTRLFSQFHPDVDGDPRSLAAAR